MEELSDLSENEAKSDEELFPESDDDDDEFELRLPIGIDEETDGAMAALPEEQSRQKRTEICAQTDDHKLKTRGARNKYEADVEQEYITTETATVSPPVEDLVIEVTREQILKRAEAEFKKKMEKVEDEEEAADPEDMDPRFIQKPKSMVVPEGEIARFTCQVDGTKPLGKRLDYIRKGNSYYVFVDIPLILLY